MDTMATWVILLAVLPAAKAFTGRADIRLVGGGQSWEGRVEVYLNGKWGTVCDDLWNDENAEVVCRHLGLSTSYATPLREPHFGAGSGSIHLDEVGCRGDEARLTDCPSNAVGVNDCGHDEDAGVSCSPSQGCRPPCQRDCGTEGLTRDGSNGPIVNVAYGKSSSVSSGDFPACLAVNGRTSRDWRPLNQTDSNCVYTALGDYAPWLRVDLGRHYVINNITIHRAFSSRRMSGMSVMVENQTCYTFPNATLDNYPVLDDLPLKMDITCGSPLIGRTVRLQKHGDDKTEYYRILVCELQVWVNLDDGFNARTSTGTSQRLQMNSTRRTVRCVL